MEEATTRVVQELEELRHSQPPPPPISDSSLSDLQTLLDNTLDNDSEPMDRLYDDLLSKSLSPSNLVCPLASAMDSGSAPLSLSASKVYLSMLLCPNSPVFTLFTPMAFLSLLRSIRRCLKCRPLGQPGSNDPSQGSQIAANRKRKTGARGRGAKKRGRSGCDGEHESEESEFDARVLFSVLKSLEKVMNLIHLDRFPDSLKSLIQTMAEIPVMAIEVCGNSENYDKLTKFCSQILVEVLRPEHGDQALTAAEVVKSLSSLILQLKSQARTFALEFVTSRMADVANRSDGVKKAMVNLPKYLVVKAPERSEPRALAVESIMEIVRIMEFEDQLGFVEHVLKMSKGKSNLRLLAIDLILMLVTSLRDPLGLNTENEVKDSWGMKCLEALVQRCSDVVAGIRARALSNLSQLVGFLSGNSRSQDVLKEVMAIGRGGEGRGNELLKARCTDEKAAVRKAALHLVAKLTSLFGSGFHGALLNTMGMACSDPLVSIRKAAVSAISEAFRTSPEENVIREWLHSVPRLITDNESSIQEECENLFLELVLERIFRSASTGLAPNRDTLYKSKIQAKSFDQDFELLFPEGVLGLLREICHGEVAPWVKKLCTSLGKKNKLKQKIATALQSIIRTSESLWLSYCLPIEKWTAPPGAWFLLSEVSAYLAKAVDWEFLHHHWQLLDQDGIGVKTQSPHIQGDICEEDGDVESNSVAWAGDRVFLLQTISNVSVELPSEPAADLAHNLFKRLDEFNMHLTEVKAHVKALKTLCKRKASSLEESDTLITKWVKQLLSKASNILEKCISENSEANRNGTYLTPPRSGTKKTKKAKAMARSLSQAVTAVYTIGSLVIHCPSVDTNTIVPLLHTIITSGNPDPKLNKLLGPRVSFRQAAPSLYIQAWLALGKICLADGKLAKRYIPIFVQELEKSDCAALRNNLVVIMADFCIHHTALVDCYITKITKCLRDPCELVRRQTFTLLSRLLQRDYVKWRGVLFLRFLLSLVDESEKIRQLADFLFGNILKVKAPLIAYNSFIEAIFVLNDCHAHSGHSDSHGSRTESRLFSVRGNDERSRSKRMHVYVSLLKQMAPEHLLATFAKLCAEILAAASDGALNIDDVTGHSVLQDTFQILACKEIRIQSNRGLSSDSAEIEEDGDGSASAAAARGKAITQAVKKGLIQNMIPIFIELKRLLEGKNSPLIGSLMECLRVLLKDYKNEIDEILIADKQLQKELMYDMQKYEAAKAKSTAAEAVANNLKASCSFQSPDASKVGAGKQNYDNAKLASAMADATAAATAQSVLKEVNKGIMSPPLSALNVPKLKSCEKGSNPRVDRPLEVLESLRKRQNFDSDEEN
ncbi:Condensin subunit 1/Condensin-2 complex subunit D [Parasponia andersonii]|uniref:Condensin subunit 1/Condensin-2 complex subunit D n=1 Tax=Parasponia andersonii TaxID=3476 RepID=A0A2P5E4A7_PARAD|nr:Condensin subunit 1/Condensin-2 complex subunit D [Parasponia andersonii]